MVQVAEVLGVPKGRVKLASPESVLQISGFPVGSVPPFGHRTPVPVLLDASVRIQPPPEHTVNVES